MENKYILDKKGNPVLEPDLFKWAKWFEVSRNRRVAQDFVKGVNVSTVFLAMDHSFGIGKSLLYETMTFGGYKEIQERYHTKEEALIGHKNIVDLINK